MPPPKRMRDQMRRVNNRRNNSSRPRDSRSLPPDVALYTGPSIYPTTIQPETDTRELHYFVAATSSAGGVIDQVFSSSASSVGVRSLAITFSNFTNWREYRVLSLRVEYHPSYINCNPQTGTPATALATPFWTIVDRDDASSAGSYANIADVSSLRIHSLMQPWVRVAKQNQFGEGNFVLITADNTEFFSIKAFSTGLSANTTYGHFYVRWIVQFLQRV